MTHPPPAPQVVVAAGIAAGLTDAADLATRLARAGHDGVAIALAIVGAADEAIRRCAMVREAYEDKIPEAGK